MNWRNRIVGGIAIAFGLTIVVLLAIDGRWDNHDTTKPLKALFGGFAFIGLGAWYLIRGAKAESWREAKTPLGPNGPRKTKAPDIGATIGELESQPSFQAECQKVEAEMRERATKMERAFDPELNRKS